MSKQLTEWLRPAIGREKALDQLPAALRNAVTNLGAPVVGAHLVCCSDESERESSDAFDRGFVRHMLPPLKHFNPSAFRTITLGGRTEAGALAIAEQHYATHPSETAFKVLVTKLNSHVAVSGPPSDPIYGLLSRYDQESTSCGALRAVLDGVDWPAIRELTDMFGSERLGALRDPNQCDPRTVPLRMAIASAHLQSQALVAEIENYQATTPTIYLVAACVTLNRERDDSEISARISVRDSRDPEQRCDFGLGSDPIAYRLSYEGQSLVVADSHSDESAHND